MFKLYGRNNTGSTAVEALLVLADVPHAVVEVEKQPDGAAPSWYLAINPRGEVPALQLPDGSIMTESAAMMIYLADRYPVAAMAPAHGSAARGQYLRWMVYLATAAYTSDLRMYYPDRYSINPDHAEAVKAKAIIDLNRDFDIFAGEMGAGPFVLGEQLSAVDIYAAMLLSWSEDMAGLFKRQPKLGRLFELVASVRPLRMVFERHGLV